MKEMTNENIIIFDWFSFTIKNIKPDNVAAFLGLYNVPFSDAPGAKGYQKRFYFAGISIHYLGRSDMGVWVEMSGEGCRTFEDFSDYGWFELFSYVLNNDDVHITRLDIAFDDHEGLLPLDRIASDVEASNYVSRSTWWEVVRSSSGLSCYLGSPKSLVRIRFYDKAAERNYDDSVHWIRLELQLRDERACEFLKLIYNGNEGIGFYFFSVIYNYLRFVNPSLDSNKSRWPNTDYWDLLCDGLPKISIYTAPGSDYNLAQVENFVFERCGNAIDCVLQTMSTERFLYGIKYRTVSRNPKYDRIVSEWHEARKRGLTNETEDL